MANAPVEQPQGKTPDIELTECGIVPPPTEAELPYEDGVPMETSRHQLQMELLIDPLMIWLEGQDAYVSGNMFVYFSPEQVRNFDFKGPDVFVVLDVPNRERKSWVVWDEGKGPDVVIELLSESTAARDKTEKKQIYQNRLRVPEYYWYNPFQPDDFAGFVLRDGCYEALDFDAQGRLLSPKLGLLLARWSGVYKGIETVWLRWATPDGIWLPTPQEIAKREHQRAERAEQFAEQAQQQAERERQRAEQLLAQLKALGVEPETFDNSAGNT